MKNRTSKNYYLAKNRFLANMPTDKNLYHFSVNDLPYHLVLCVGTDDDSIIDDFGEGLTIKNVTEVVLLNNKGQIKNLDVIDVKNITNKNLNRIRFTIHKSDSDICSSFKNVTYVQ